MNSWHVPVLLEPVLETLAVRIGGRYVDGTLGGGGHAAAVAERVGPEGVVLGIDQDPAARARAGERLAPFADRVRIAAGNFSEVVRIVDEHGLRPVDGILLDLGVSSHQLDTADRGFAIRHLGPLDMRMDSESEGIDAAELLNTFSEAEIARILFEYGEESRSRRIAAEIVRARPLRTTEDLVDCVRRTMPFRTRPGEIHPATKVFQAVRIAVNRELDVLREAIDAAVSVLAPGGRLVVISYHSLEDRIVKESFRRWAGMREGNDLPTVEPDPEPVLKIVTRKPVVPTESEIRVNPRSRSAKLRCAERHPSLESAV